MKIPERTTSDPISTQMQRHRVHNPAGNDYEFNGVMVAEASAPRIGTVMLYRTEAGRWVVSQADNVMRPNASLTRAAVLDSDAELREWLGNAKEAKQLLESVGIKVTDWIE